MSNFTLGVAVSYCRYSEGKVRCGGFEQTQVTEGKQMWVKWVDSTKADRTGLRQTSCK